MALPRTGSFLPPIIFLQKLTKFFRNRPNILTIFWRTSYHVFKNIFRTRLRVMVVSFF